MKKNNKGFTLAELLIVVAIIAVLVAIAIPVFTTQLEKSREATDIANLRSGYAAAVTEYLAKGQSAQAVTVPATQTIYGTWVNGQTPVIGTTISGFAEGISVSAPNGKGGWDITVNSSGSVLITAKAG